MRSATTTRRRDDAGSTTPLIVGFTLILLLATAVVVDASAAYLQRSGLNSIADGAALAGTESVDVDGAYTGGLGVEPDLVRPQAEAAVTAYLAEVGATGRYPGLRVRGVRVTSSEVVVRVEAPLKLPWGLPGLGDATTIGSTGSAALTLG